MDSLIFNFINSFSQRYWLLDYFGIFLAQYFGYFLFVIAAALILKEKKWQERIHFASLILLSVILSRGIIAEVIKFFTHRPRPFSALNITPLIDKQSDIYASFPSGHASLFFALAFAIFLYYFDSENNSGKSLGWKFLFAAFLISLRSEE